MGTFTTVLFVAVILFRLYQYIDNAFTPKKVVQNQPAAISNGKERRLDLLTHYFSVLKIDQSNSITHELVERHYSQCIMELNDSSFQDQSIQEKRIEVEAARTYLLDFINYMAHIS